MNTCTGKVGNDGKSIILKNPSNFFYIIIQSFTWHQMTWWEFYFVVVLCIFVFLSDNRLVDNFLKPSVVCSTSTARAWCRSPWCRYCEKNVMTLAAPLAGRPVKCVLTIELVDLHWWRSVTMHHNWVVMWSVFVQVIVPHPSWDVNFADWFLTWMTTSW